jgi:phosphoglycolate phosphatase
MFEIPKLSVVTAEDVTAHKPDPEGLLVNLDRLGIKAEESIVLGDHPVDIEAAKAAGINAIGITHGFGTSAELRLAGAINTASRLSEVIKMVRRHNSGEKLLF